MNESWRTIMALIRVSPPSSNEPPVAARTEDEAEARQRAAKERRDDMSMVGREPCSIIGGGGRGERKKGRGKKKTRICSFPSLMNSVLT